MASGFFDSLFGNHYNGGGQVKCKMSALQLLVLTFLPSLFQDLCLAVDPIPQDPGAPEGDYSPCIQH
jgi:hypothetical protein